MALDVSDYAPDVQATQATSITTAVTANAYFGTITTQTATAAASGNHQFVLNNSLIQPTSCVFVQVTGYSGTYGTNGNPDAKAALVNTAGGSATITIVNDHNANALNGTLTIAFQVG